MMLMKNVCSVLVGICTTAVLTAGSLAADVKPKYGPEAQLLNKSHTYVANNKAVDFWNLVPYYVSQQDDRSCSLASVTMVINAARAAASAKGAASLTADDELATQKNLLNKLPVSVKEPWAKNIGEGGHGVTLDELAPYVEAVFKAYGFETVRVQVVHIDDAVKSKKAVHEALAKNEQTSHDFIIANFIQGAYTGDADVGHIAPVAAYDSTTKKVLIFDPDRQWYEPYWVSEDTFIKGMATRDKQSNRSRGFLLVSY